MNDFEKSNDKRNFPCPDCGALRNSEHTIASYGICEYSEGPLEEE